MRLSVVFYRKFKKMIILSVNCPPWSGYSHITLQQSAGKDQIKKGGKGEGIPLAPIRIHARRQDGA
jgi:hypothetical protein